MKTGLLSLLLFITVPLGNLTLGQESPAEPRETAPIALPDLTRFLDPWVEDEMKKAKIPGAALAIVQDGRILYEAGYGWSDIGFEVPADPVQSVFRVGSLSKPVTASVVLATLEAEGLGPEEAVEPLLRDLSLRPSYERSLTFEHLLSHTAGFNEHLFGQHAEHPGSFLPLPEFLRRTVPPRFIEPGKIIAYVDYHTCLAGEAAARIEGIPFEELAWKRLFSRLEMNRSTFRQTNLQPEIEASLARSYLDQRGHLVPMQRDYVQSTPAAGLYSTAHDLALYLIALSEESPGVMSALSWRAQKTLQFSHHPKLDGRSFGFVHSSRNGHRILYKDGQASGFSARLVLLPDLGMGWVSMHNRNILGPLGAINEAGRFHRHLADALLERYFPRRTALPELVPPQPDPDFESRLPLYLGTYRNVVSSRHTWEKLISMGDVIEVSDEGGGRLKIGGGSYVEVEPGLFQWHEGHDFHAAFAREEAAATHLFLGAGAYERIPWYSAPNGTLWLSSSALLILLAGAVMSGLQLARGRHETLPAKICKAQLIFVVANIAFLTAFALVFVLWPTPALFFGAPLHFRIALFMPLMSVLALLVVGVWTAAAWVRRRWTIFYRCWLTLQFLAGATLLFIFHHWNLLVWPL